MTDQLLNLLIKSLKRQEGIVLKPYKDTVGKLSIGIGRNLDANGISLDEAELMLKNDINKAYENASIFTWFDDLNDARKMVIISMIFNLGFRGFFAFRKLMQAMEDKNYNQAADQMIMSEWAVTVNQRAKDLSAVMRTGEILS